MDLDKTNSIEWLNVLHFVYPIFGKRFAFHAIPDISKMLRSPFVFHGGLFHEVCPMAGLWLLVASENLRADSRVREGTSGDLMGPLGSAGKSPTR